MKERTNLAIRVIEVASNIAIVIVATAIVIVSYQRWTLGSRENIGVRVGDSMQVSGVDWAKMGVTLGLAISSDCRFCAESVAFHRELVKRARQAGVNVITLMPQEEATARQYLRNYALDVQTIRQLNAATRIRGVPTIVLVGGDGVVRGVWPGKLNPRQERDVLAQLAILPADQRLRRW